MLRHSATGLLVAENAADERSVRRELQRLDPTLVLTQEMHPSKRLEYVVVKTFTDGSALTLTRWRDDVTGQPLPLSHGLVEKVKRMDPNTRAPQLDTARHNAELQDRIEQRMLEAAEEVARERELAKGRSPVFHRSRGLYLARARARARGESA